MFVCYILQSAKSGRFYTGHCETLSQRLHDHHRGHVVATRGKGPWELVYQESFPTRAEAMRREIEVKSWKSAVMIRELVDKERSGRPEDREGR